MQRVLKLDMPQVKPWTKYWNIVTELSWHGSDFNPKRVRIKDLIAIQPSVKLKGLLTCDSDLRIYVVKIGEKKFIRDGHHRVTKARLLGKKTIDALVAEA